MRVPQPLVAGILGMKLPENSLRVGSARKGHLYLPCEPGSKLLVLGMVIQPLMTGILIMGNINPYGLGLMSLSPIIWKCHVSLDPIAHAPLVPKKTIKNQWNNGFESLKGHSKKSASECGTWGRPRLHSQLYRFFMV